MWEKIFGSVASGTQNCNGLDVNQNGDIYLGSNTAGFGVSNTNDMLLLKVTSEGNLEWAKLFGGAGLNGARNLLALEDGGVMVLGATTGFG